MSRSLSAVTEPGAARTQSSRSAQTKARLIDAAIGCLVDRGYAYTTVVEICSRAGLTRGAYNHHYAAVAELLRDVVETLYQRLAADGNNAVDSLESLIQAGWAKMERPEFKAVIELWLASRNEPELGAALAPEIARLAQLFEPAANSRLSQLLGSAPELVAFYRLSFETLIGLGVGRATSLATDGVAHEEQVLNLLLSLARERDLARGSDGRN